MFAFTFIGDKDSPKRSEVKYPASDWNRSGESSCVKVTKMQHMEIADSKTSFPVSG